MKLSDMTIGQGADLALQLAIESEAFFSDTDFIEQAKELWGKRTKDKEKAMWVGKDIAVFVIKAMAGKYRENIYRILGAVYSKSTAEIDKMKISEITETIQELLKDESVLSFFPQLRQSEPKTQPDTSPNVDRSDLEPIQTT